MNTIILWKEMDVGTSCDEIEGEQENARESFNPIHLHIYQKSLFRLVIS